jgi:hypothetical protein
LFERLFGFVVRGAVSSCAVFWREVSGLDPMLLHLYPSGGIVGGRRYWWCCTSNISAKPRGGAPVATASSSSLSLSSSASSLAIVVVGTVASWCVRWGPVRARHAVRSDFERSKKVCGCGVVEVGDGACEFVFTNATSRVVKSKRVSFVYNGDRRSRTDIE